VSEPPDHNHPLDSLCLVRACPRGAYFTGMNAAKLEVRQCPATREAVEEQEEIGEVGCPLCGFGPRSHLTEADFEDRERELDEVEEMP